MRMQGRQGMTGRKDVGSNLGLSSLHAQVWNHQTSLRRASAEAAKLTKEAKFGKIVKDDRGREGKQSKSLQTG